MKRSWIFWVWLLFIIPLACEKELSEPEGSTDSLVIEEAKQWYYTQVAGTIDLKSGKEDKKTKTAIPLWDDTKSSKNKQMEVVEVGLKTEGGWGFLTESSFTEWLKSNNKGYLISNTRLVIKKNLETGKRVSFLMTIIGEKHYAEAKKFRIWQGNSYLKKDKDFSGLVLFHNLNGSFVNGWRYTSGKVTHTVQLNFEDPLEIKLKSSYCYTVPLYGWFENCTDWYYSTISNGVESGLSPNGTSCGIPYVDILGYVNECYYYDEGGNGGGSYREPIGETVQLDTKLSSLFQNGSLLEGRDNETLNKVFERLYQECLFKQITDQLISRNISLGKILMDPSSIGSGGIRSTGNLVFGNSESINEKTLSHEWFHVAQWKLNGINIFANENEGMAEFENALLEDIIETIRIGGDFEGSGTTHRFALYGGSTFRNVHEKYKYAYRDWLKQLTLNGTRYPNAIPSNEFLDFAKKFGEVNRSYSAEHRGNNYDISSYQPVTMISLFNSCK